MWSGWWLYCCHNVESSFCAAEKACVAIAGRKSVLMILDGNEQGQVVKSSLQVSPTATPVNAFFLFTRCPSIDCLLLEKQTVSVVFFVVLCSEET